MKKIVVLFIIAISLVACKQEKKSSTPNESKQEELIDEAQKSLADLSLTHHAKDFKSHQVVRFQIESTADKPSFRVTMRTDLSRFKIQTQDSKYVYFDGAHLYSSEEDLPEDLRTQMLSAVYYFSLPYFIEDHTEEVMNKKMDTLFHIPFTSLELKQKNNPFRPAKDNNLKTYTAPVTHFLSAIKFTNSANKELLMLYQNYFTVENILIAKYWEFYDYDENTQENPTVKEKVTLSHITFFTPQKGYFEVPKSAKILE